jgi:hypothetical protein
LGRKNAIGDIRTRLVATWGMLSTATIPLSLPKMKIEGGSYAVDLVVHFGVSRQVFLRFEVRSCYFRNRKSDLRSPRQVIGSHVS